MAKLTLGGILTGAIIALTSVFAMGFLAAKLLDLGWPGTTQDRWVAAQAWAGGLAAVAAIGSTVFTIVLISQTQNELRLAKRADRLAHDPQLLVLLDCVAQVPPAATTRYEAGLSRFGLADPATTTGTHVLTLRMQNVQSSPMGFANAAGVHLCFTAPNDNVPVRFLVGAGMLLAGEQKDFVFATTTAAPAGMSIVVEKATLRSTNALDSRSLLVFGTTKLTFPPGEASTCIKVTGAISLVRDN